MGSLAAGADAGAVGAGNGAAGNDADAAGVGSPAAENCADVAVAMRARADAVLRELTRMLSGNSP